MKYKTGQQRHCAAVDAYLHVTKKTEFKINEVADWMVKNKLFPVPSTSRVYNDADREKWERNLEIAAPGFLSLENKNAS